MDQIFQMNSTSLMEERNKRVDEIIRRYATRNTWINVLAGVPGFIPIPIVNVAGSIAGCVAAIWAQKPVIFEPMIEEIAQVYLLPPEAIAGTENIIKQNARLGAYGLTTNLVGKVVVEQVLLKKLTEKIISDLMKKQLIRKLLMSLLPKLTEQMLIEALVPIIGGVAAMTAGGVIGYNITWRVGSMTAAYFLNGGWLGGSPQATDEILKPYTKGLQPLGGNVNTIPQIPAVQENIVTLYLKYITEIWETIGITPAQALALLAKRQLSPELDKKILQRVADYLKEKDPILSGLFVAFLNTLP